NEVFGAVGYRDGGKRFITIAPPNPEGAQQAQVQQGLALQNMLAEIAKKRAQAAHAQAQAGHAQMLGTAAMAKIGLEHRRAAADERNASFDHAHQLHDRLLAAHDQGHRHAMALADRMTDDRRQTTDEEENDPSSVVSLPSSGPEDLLQQL